MSTPGAIPGYAGGYEQVVQEVATSTQSEIIRFFVIVLVILVVVLLPLYYMILKDRKTRLVHEDVRQDKYIARESQIIEVVKANTAAISELKATLELSRTTTSDSLARIHERLDTQSKHCTDHTMALVQIQFSLDEMVKDLRGTADPKKGDGGA